MSNNHETDTSAIDRAIAAAKARKAAKAAKKQDEAPESNTGEEPTASTDESAQVKEQAKKDREQKQAARELEAAARKAAREQKRQEKQAELAKITAEKKAAREQKRAEKLAARAEQKSKTSRLAAAKDKLPALTGVSQQLIDRAADLTTVEITALAAHLNYLVRARGAQLAVKATVKLEEGTQVRITGGDPRFVGCIGTITRSQRVRCFVTVPGNEKPLYVYLAEVEPVTVEEPTTCEPEPIAVSG
jgi:hypothetical protein